ncbi:MAG: mannose-1-phosphate guanylyltransferase [Kiritimatiellae bacterium]|nr:mannose-1-phosphate guanylyltransferase [Kiritimatiellia bacterium]
MLSNAYAVILAGGKGERFWPLSTSKRPKQLLSLVGGTPLLGLAMERVDTLIPRENVFVITNADLVAPTREIISGLPEENIIGEPFGRDTAAAAALGCVLVRARDPNGVFCILTADHIIKDIDVFRRTLGDSLALAAAENVLVTMGITPTFPSTGFGYIEAGEPLAGADATAFFKAKRFVEKPDRETAEQYLRSGRFFWNSGMFVWSVKSFAAAIAAHAPPLQAMMDTLGRLPDARGVVGALDAEYGKLEKISIDYALMEKASNIVMAQGTFNWDDVGSWSALENHFEAGPDGNITVGAVEPIEATGNIVVSDARLTALIGVHDLVVVQAEGATLICPKGKAQDVKKIVERLRERGTYEELL